MRDDRDLLKRAQANAAGFGALFDAYYDRIYKYAYRRVGSRETAEDIAASVFEDALRGIKRLRWQDKPLVAWLYRIAARRVADHYRAARDHAPLDDALIARADDPHDRATRAEESRIVQRGLAKLAAPDREIIRLAYFDELRGEAIAAILNCSASNVYVRLHRALKKLERIVSDEIH
ncbi:MAG: sigma-70 family RNA polymerase sigma factor [Chloroflexi bacterium]|nr:sigma-70 family RNA polymerase sigma factor [Chloroflexota bacterium]